MRPLFSWLRLTPEGKARLPSLDGLRAVSIIFVLISHVMNGHALDQRSYWRVFGNGALGVFIFFVISGFIITRLLIIEENKTGTISLSKFYIKRIFRILPPLYLYILFVVLAAGVTGIHVTAGSVASAALFAQNISPWATDWPFEHIWSLSIEEQFYLLWPAMLLVLLKGGSKKYAIICAIGLILAAPLFRMSLFLFFHTDYFRQRIGALLPSRMDALMFGCLVSLLEGSG